MKKSDPQPMGEYFYLFFYCVQRLTTSPSPGQYLLILGAKVPDYLCLSIEANRAELIPEAHLECLSVCLYIIQFKKSVSKRETISFRSAD